MAHEDFSGRTVGRLTVIKRVPPPNRDIYWKCKCSCGVTVTITSTSLRTGTKSCGCLAREGTAKRSFKHGMCNTPEYNSWCAAKARCNNPKNADYADYGGRGIRMCDAWNNEFAVYFAAVGKRPSPFHTLDRIDVNGHYEPGNVRWATPLEQANNTRTTKRLIYAGEPKTRRELSQLAGIPHQRVRDRAKRGWNADRIISQPPKASHFLTLNGITRTVAQWARKLNITVETLHKRIRLGWSDEDVLTIGVGRILPNARYITFRGKRQHLRAWAIEYGLNRTTLEQRLKKGWPMLRALTQPVQ